MKGYDLEYVVYTIIFRNRYVGYYMFAVCIPIAYFMSYWNVPFLPLSCMGAMPEDKALFKTMVRTMPSISKIGGSLVALFQVRRPICPTM